MSAAMLLPASPTSVSTTDFVNTVLAEASRATAFAAWTDPSRRATWWGGHFEGAILEAVEPVWLELACRTPFPGGVTIEERVSVTFVQLGERTHIALHATARSAVGVHASVSASAWRRRLQHLCDEVAGRTEAGD